MPENATLYQRVQLGIESPAGTPVAATRLLAGATVNFTAEAETSPLTPSGFKFPTIVALNREWVTLEMTGPLNYTEIIYPLSSLIATVSPTGAGTAKTWTFTPDSDAPNTRTVYTLEHGSDEWGRRMSYCLFNGMTLNFSRRESTFTTRAMAQAISDNFNMTDALTSVELVPALPTQQTIKIADTAAGLAGASVLTRAFEATVGLENLGTPVWPLNSGVSGFAAMVDSIPSTSSRFRVAVDSAGMAPLTKMRAGSTQFVRITSTGASISGGGNYTFQVDLAMKILRPRFQDLDGLWTVDWEGVLTHDPTWTKAMEIVVTNIQTAL